MFKKLIFSLFMIAMVSACNACAHNPKDPYDDARGDKDAEYAQNLMRNAVKIEQKLKVEVTDAFFPGNSDTFEGAVAGSGVVIARDLDTGRSAIATAWHVCDMYKVGDQEQMLWLTMKIVEKQKRVLTIDGQELEILESVYEDKNNDICVLEVRHEFEGDSDIADDLPPRGAYVDVVGSPIGMWGDFMVSMERGRYFGKTDLEVLLSSKDEAATDMKNFSYYGIPVVGGYSGSGIYYRGKLVGLLTAASPKYEHMSFGPDIKDLRHALKKAGYDD